MHISRDNWNFGERPFGYFFALLLFLRLGHVAKGFQYYDPDLTLAGIAWGRGHWTSWAFELRVLGRQI